MENKSGSMNEKMVSQEHDTERTINRKDNKAKNEALTYIRDYRVMTNFKYRLITNILIPLLAILASMLIACSKTIWTWIGVMSNYLLFLYDVRGGAGLFLLRLYVQEECIWHAFFKDRF